jgi:hypothetical protein
MKVIRKLIWGRFINTFLPPVLSFFSLPAKGHLSESTLMQFRNECPWTTWSLHGWNPIYSSVWKRKQGTLSPRGCWGVQPIQDCSKGPTSRANPLIVQMGKLRLRARKTSL